MRKTAVILIAIGLIAVIAFLFFMNDSEDETNEDQTKDRQEETTEKEQKTDYELARESLNSRNLKPVDYAFAPEPTKDVIENQQEIEQTIIEESEGSTFQDPYIKLDPYNRTPLSALVVFETEEPATVTYTVKGKDGGPEISNSTTELTTRHELPILGLYPNHTNEITIKSIMEDGNTQENSISIETQPLPDYIGSISIETIKKEKVDMPANGLNFAIPSTKFVYGFDTNGDVRWYSSQYNSHVFKRIQNGNFLYLGKDNNGGPAYNRLFEIDLMGKIYKAFKISDDAAISEAEGLEQTLIHHDIAELPNGNWLMTVNDGSENYMEDTMIEVNPTNGEVVKLIDLKDLYPIETYEEYTAREPKDGKLDWFHQNSVVYDESDNTIIISGRNQDTVMKIDYLTNEIIWILAHPDGFNDEFLNNYVVEGQGENFKYPGAQHDATIMPDLDENDDTIDLLIYDNNVAVARGDKELSRTYSAATQYRINEKTREAEIIWSYGEERGKELFTNIIGSAKYLEDSGNRLIDFGHVADGTRSHIIEATDDQDAEVVFEAVISDFPSGAWIYRSQRYPLYNDEWRKNFTVLE
ncbi:MULTISPECIES: aryl-sulfate sulfotransferase [Allobacillus]|uniref:Aryl-sulfate sulfotransferase n=1 Tax=Allobacillus salarius TaxID=1955272 RepID=A0A556PMN6_9BACI|nr:aryl-sulfate sulfotransferase [Allobacillus salarius]TSJ65665.1 aryl-sulfate sulfotransferase [Allobacillus salarius]